MPLCLHITYSNPHKSPTKWILMPQFFGGEKKVYRELEEYQKPRVGRRRAGVWNTSLTPEFPLFLLCHHSSQFLWLLVHGSVYFAAWSFNGINDISEFQGYGLKRCLPIELKWFAIKSHLHFHLVHTHVFLSISFLPGSKPGVGGGGYKASHSLCLQCADSNLLLKPDSHGEGTLATPENERFLAFVHTLNSITAAEEVSSAALFLTNAHELFQKLMDQLNEIR